jgi:hypothetical protein
MFQTRFGLHTFFMAAPTRFAAEGILNASTGMDYREKILRPGSLLARVLFLTINFFRSLARWWSHGPKLPWQRAKPGAQNNIIYFNPDLSRMRS